jgi:hypothetical protein
MKTPSIKSINAALAEKLEGPAMRLSTRGNTLYVEWMDTDECSARIPAGLREQVLHLLADPDGEWNNYYDNDEYALVLLGLR